MRLCAALLYTTARPVALALTPSLNKCGEFEIRNNCPLTKIDDGIEDPGECARRINRVDPMRCGYFHIESILKLIIRLDMICHVDGRRIRGI